MHITGEDAVTAAKTLRQHFWFLDTSVTPPAVRSSDAYDVTLQELQRTDGAPKPQVAIGADDITDYPSDSLRQLLQLLYANPNARNGSRPAHWPEPVRD